MPCERASAIRRFASSANELAQRADAEPQVDFVGEREQPGVLDHAEQGHRDAEQQGRALRARIEAAQRHRDRDEAQREQPVADDRRHPLGQLLAERDQQEGDTVQAQADRPVAGPAAPVRRHRAAGEVDEQGGQNPRGSGQERSGGQVDAHRLPFTRAFLGTAAW